MKRFSISALAAVGMAMVVTAPAGAALKVGDKAPTLQVASWVKGQPVKGFEKGKVYVVEFWATWCGPCKASIPHLTELAHKFKGKVTFTGVSVFEHKSSPTDTSYQAGVSKFVTDMGDKMDYNVAVDGPDGTMGTNWMRAADEGGIPTAFVIGKDSTVAWIGHPMAELSDVLDKVLADTWDSKTFAEERTKRKAASVKFNNDMKPVSRLAQQKKFKEAVDLLDKVMVDNPTYANDVTYFKFSLLLQGDEPAAYSYAKKLAEGQYKDDAMALNQLAWAIVADNAKLKTPDFDIALAIAQRAATASKNADATILDTLAFAYYRKGDFGKAVSTQERALKLLAEQKDAPEQTRKELTTHLELFKAKQ